ncbi:MAG: GFA family protein [Woeseiaceae bacterium]|nr:GFA family protein [Woeseiaceae bacterium]
MSDGRRSVDGGCACAELRYRLEASPLFVHCCHCSWCQRETGSAFAVNALIETSRIRLLAGRPDAVRTPSASGKGQLVQRCPTCRVGVWSHYAGFGEVVAFVRAGTLDDPAAVSPDVHIYTSTKLPWVNLPADVPSFADYYVTREQWPAASLERLKRLRHAD